MRKVALYILAILLLASCGTIRKSRKSDASDARKEERIMMTQLVEPQQPDELTASMSVNVSGVKLNGQIRMRRDHSIQLSASVLGLMEVVRIEFLPDQVVIVDRMNSRYCICHYAFLPFHNELGLDFQVIQAIMWNRAFSPDAPANDRYSNFAIQDNSPESFTFKETQYGYVFKSDKDLNLVRTSNPTFGEISYSDFGKPEKDFSFPQAITIDVKTSDLSMSIPIKLSSISTAKQKWPDRTQIPRRMKRVELEDILDELKL